MAQSQGGQVVKSEQNEWIKCNKLNALQSQEIIVLKDRIKRLEEAGDALYANCDPSRWDSTATAARKLSDQNAWRKAKEDKL